MLVLEKKKKKKKRKESVVNIWLKKKRAVSGSIPFFNDLVPKEIIPPSTTHSRPPTVHIPFKREHDRSRILSREWAWQSGHVSLGSSSDWVN